MSKTTLICVHRLMTEFACCGAIGWLNAALKQTADTTTANRRRRTPANALKAREQSELATHAIGKGQSPECI
jgi:hypothetical protein